MEGVKSDEYVPCDLTSVSRSINIASVRAASLRTCGLRAAARAASSRGSSQMGFSPSVSRASSTSLSYTNSQEPGEDSQLNAFAMVDKLIDLNAGVTWQTPESNKAAEKSCVKGSQSVNGRQCLAQSADMKNRQGKLRIFEWIDSQSDDTENVSSNISAQLEQCQRINDQSDMAIVKDLSSSIFKASSPCSKGDDSLKCEAVLEGSAKVICAKEGSTDCECLSDSVQNNAVERTVNNELHDLDASREREEAEVMDIGASTQVALEAMDIMRHGAPHSSPCEKKETFSAFDIGNDTQTALDAMDILRHGIEPNMVFLKHEMEEENKGSGCQKLGECNHIGEIVQAKAISVSKSLRRKRGLPSRLPTGCKVMSKKGFPIEASKTPKKVGKSASLKSPGPALNSNNRFLLDFSSAMVPRRKRSRLCSPRVSFNENIDAFGWQKCGPRLCEPHQEVVKQDKPEGRNNILWLGNSTELAVLAESTNGRQNKRDLSTRRDCHVCWSKAGKGGSVNPEVFLFSSVTVYQKLLSSSKRRC